MLQTRIPFVAAVSLAIFLSASAQERSFVGKKLTGITFVDTEGHTIDPDHYRGAVLVLIAGIPW